MRKNKLRLGLFIPPFHALNESPTLSLERDLDIAQFADEIGVAEVWYGEHHSGGYEIIASPELMIAAAAQRTKRIRLGTGVVSLPYHNPLTTANRLVQLDHLTRGRLLFGAGPGLLTADAHMLGIDARESRDKLAQGIDVITRLLRGEWVTEKTSWYDLRDAHCHMLPIDRIELCVASMFSPNGGRLAAKYEAGMLCLAATAPNGYDTLSGNWKTACDAAAEYGHTMNPSVVRCATDMHIAETRDQAMDQARKGFEITQGYFRNQTAHIANAGDVTLEQLIEQGEVVVGTTGRCGHPDPPPRGKSGGFRHPAPGGQELGEPREQEALDRNDHALRPAGDKSRQRQPAEVVRLAGRECRSVLRHARAGHGARIRKGSG